MKNSSPRQLALIISIFVSLVSAVIISLSLYLAVENPLYPIAGGMIISFLISCFLIYSAVNNFILDKINQIKGKNILLARSDISRIEFYDALINKGAQVHDIVVYKTVQNVSNKKYFEEILNKTKIPKIKDKYILFIFRVHLLL